MPTGRIPTTCLNIGGNHVNNDALCNAGGAKLKNREKVKCAKERLHDVGKESSACTCDYNLEQA